jgi:hypothetical protein
MFRNRFQLISSRLPAISLITRAHTEATQQESGVNAISASVDAVWSTIVMVELQGLSTATSVRSSSHHLAPQRSAVADRFAGSQWFPPPETSVEAELYWLNDGARGTPLSIARQPPQEET